MNLFPNPKVNDLTTSQANKYNAEWDKLVGDEGLELETGWYYTAAIWFSNQINEHILKSKEDDKN